MEEKKQEIDLIETIKPNEEKDDWSKLSGKPKGLILNQIDEKGIVKNIDASTIRTGVLTGTKIQTNPTSARVVIGGDGDERNDILLIDDTTGGTNPVTGNTASIKFARSDDNTQVFRIQKRSGISSDDQNVIEMFFEKDANSSSDNYIFIGRKGGENNSDSKTDIISVIGKDVVFIGNSNNDSINNITLWNSNFGGGWNSGGTRLLLSASKTTTDADYNPLNGSGGAAVLFGLFNNNSDTFNLYMWIDTSNLWLASDIIPYTDAGSNLGNSTHGFKEIYLSDSNGNNTGKLTVNSSNGKLQWNGVDIS